MTEKKISENVANKLGMNKVFADVGVSVIAVLNALRILRVRSNIKNV